MSREEENNRDEERPSFENKDILAFILAMYRVLLPQFLVIVLIFFLVAFLLLKYWFN